MNELTYEYKKLQIGNMLPIGSVATIKWGDEIILTLRNITENKVEEIMDIMNDVYTLGYRDGYNVHGDFELDRAKMLN